MAEKITHTKEQITGVVSVMGSLYFFLILFTHHLRDPVLFFRSTEPPEPLRNLGGIVGAYVSGWLLILFGISAYAIPVFIMAFGIKRFLGREGHKIYLLGSLLFLVSSSILSALLSNTFTIAIEKYPDGVGGLTGRGIAVFAESLVSVPGSYIFSLSLFLSSLILISPVSVTSIALRRKKKGTGTKKYHEEIEEAVPEEQEILIRAPDPLPVSLPVSRHEVVTPRKEGGYELPHLEILSPPDPVSSKPSKDDLLTDSSIIAKKLEDFGVDGKITEVHPGPIVTMYEFEPAPGVKINRIVSLAEDLALSLKAQSVRISPIPGRAAIGIEVPNKQRETVALREILASEGFKKSKSKLTLGLGKDISGMPVIADLSKMPHLLVAGATGAGKSVSINSMVMSILYKATPAEVKMLMVDPKLLELSAYEDIPHLISPVITSPKAASEALKKMVIEMERRYRVLAERAARNIDGFNLQARDEERLPHIVIIIDELADLMFTAPSDVEDSITRLAQMGRASGIHLILATQRPSVDVITGIIKSNIPSRIAFAVSSGVDSRTILDHIGAERLLGYGDMLYVPIGEPASIRIQGVFVSDDEVRRVAEAASAQGKPRYDDAFIRLEGLDKNEGFVNASDDPLFEEIKEYVISTQKASTSSLQRRFALGYNRAARMIDALEEQGVIGPSQGSKPRDVYVKRED